MDCVVSILREYLEQERHELSQTVAQESFQHSAILTISCGRLAPVLMRRRRGRCGEQNSYLLLATI